MNRLGHTLKGVIGSLLNEYLRDDKIILFDVGAKGGTIELPKLAPFTNVYAFEPNPQEFERLKVTNKNSPQYHNIHCFEIGLSDREGIEPFYITKKASYSSLLTFDVDSFERHLSAMGKFDMWLNDFNVEKTISIRTTSLDSFCAKDNLAKPDFLKLDTQGSELKILYGARQLLDTIGVIKCEVNFVRAYKGQSLFSEIDLFLRQNEFEFVDCQFYPDTVHSGTHNPKKGKLYDRPRFSGGADAIYVNTGLNDKNKIIKAGLILAELGYLSESYFLLEQGINDKKDIEKLVQYLFKQPLRNKAKNFMKDWLPPRITSILKTMFEKLVE